MANFSENLTIGWVFASATENIAISCFHPFFINFSSILFSWPRAVDRLSLFHHFWSYCHRFNWKWSPISHELSVFNVFYHLCSQTPDHCAFYPAPLIVTSSVLSNITWMFQTSHVFLLVGAVHRISLNCINALYSIAANPILPVPNFINSLYSIDVNQILPVLLLACWAMRCYKHHYSRVKFGRCSFHLPTSPFSAHRVCPSTFIVEAWPIV